MDRLTCKCDGDNVLKELCIFDRESNINDCLGCKEYCDTVDDLGGDCDNCAIQRAFDKLADYEDLEEQGLLLKLPCKVGDTLYYVSYEFDIYIPVQLDMIIITHLNCYQYNCCSFDAHGDVYEEFEFDTDDFGKTVFLTIEEAEKALKRLESAE